MAVLATTTNDQPLRVSLAKDTEPVLRQLDLLPGVGETAPEVQGDCYHPDSLPHPAILPCPLASAGPAGVLFQRCGNKVAGSKPRDVRCFDEPPLAGKLSCLHLSTDRSAAHVVSFAVPGF